MLIFVSSDTNKCCSVPRLWAPHATPASLMQSSTGQVSSVVSGSEKHERQSKMGKVEVQEVFDLTDLHNNWREICTQKQYYVWVPNARKKAKKPLAALKRVHELVKFIHYSTLTLCCTMF